MSSKRSTNRHFDKPPNTANIRAPDAPYGIIETDIPQPEYPEGVRLASRGRGRPRGEPIPRVEVLANLHAAAAAAGTTITPNVPAVVVNPHAGPGEISKITRNDVELFFDAAHVFRTNLANVLPAIATRLGKFILAEPYTIIDVAGHAVQMVPDACAMTPVQAKLAGLVLHRMLPPITDMDIEGRQGPGKGTHVDARQVRITVNTVSNAEGDQTDARLRAGSSKGGTVHPNAAKQIAPITMNLGEIVKQAQDLVGQIDGIDPDLVVADGELTDDASQAQPAAPAPEDAKRD